MQLRRFILDGLTEVDRQKFANALLRRLIEDLRSQFPPADGYRWVWDDAKGMLRISRGKFWGLQVSLGAKDAALKVWDWKFEGYFPAFDKIMQPIERVTGRMQGSFPARFVSAHFLAPLLLIPVMVCLPFLALYRLGLLVLRSDVLAGVHRLDLLWPSMQAAWPGTAPALRRRFPILAYFLSALAAGALSFVCFKLADAAGIRENWSTAFFVAGFLLALLSTALLIAFIMASLGFEVKN